MEDEYELTDQFVPTYVNEEPVVLAGLTDLELLTCLVAPAIFSLVMSILIGFVWLGILALLLFLAMWISLSIFAVKTLRNFKRGRPKGYLGARIRQVVAMLMGRNYSLYLVDERMKVGRSFQPIVLLKD